MRGEIGFGCATTCRARRVRIVAHSEEGRERRGIVVGEEMLPAYATRQMERGATGQGQHQSISTTSPYGTVPGAIVAQRTGIAGGSAR